MSSVERRVLMLLQNAGYPSDDRVLREAILLRDAGYHVTVICPGDRGELGWETLDGIAVRRYRLLPTRGGSLAPILEWAYALASMTALCALCFLRRPFSIIHAHNPPDLLVLIAAPYKLFGCRFVYDHHDLVPEMFDLRFGGRAQFARGLLVAAERLSCRLADLVVEVNESHRDVDHSRSGVPLERAVVVRNGPDARMLTRPVVAPRSHSKLVVGYAGVIGRQDGVDVLVEAIHILVRELRCSFVSCVIAGDGEARPDVERHVAKRGLSDVISFTGWLSYPSFIDVIEGFDIGVAPEPPNDYNRCSTLVKIMDYMALGRPVVAFDLPENRVTAGDVAVYATGTSPLDLARALNDLLSDEERRLELGRLGRERAEQALAWDVVSRPLLEGYASLTRSRRSFGFFGRAL